MRDPRGILQFKACDVEPLPTPIAHALHVLTPSPQESALLILWRACDAVEIALRTMAAMLLSDVLARNALEPMIPRLREFNYRRPTLGQWKSLLLQLARHRPDISDLVTPLVELAKPGALFEQFFDGKKQPESLQHYNLRFTDLRNRLAHGAGLTQEAAEILLRSWAPRIREFLDASSGWMSGVRLYGRADAGLYLLQGLTPHPVKDIDFNEMYPAARLFVKRDMEMLELWPLMLYSVPYIPGQSLNVNDLAVQVYSSLDNDGLRVYFTPVGCPNTSVHWCQADEDTSTAFFRLFAPLRATESRSPLDALRSFRHEIVAEAKLMMGRRVALRSLMRAVFTQEHYPVVWIHGPAGCGKSILMAKVASRLLHPQEISEDGNDTQGDPAAWTADLLVIPYRFRLGDARCSRDMFVQLVGRSLGAKAGAGDNHTEGIAWLREALHEQVAKGWHVVFLLDGLDEIHAVDSSFVAEVLTSLIAAAPSGSGRATWVLAGRSSVAPELPATGIYSVFGAQGLPPMEDKDVRAMILDQIGRYRQDLLRTDIFDRKLVGTVPATEEGLRLLEAGIVPQDILQLCKGEQWDASRATDAIAIQDPDAFQPRRWLIDDDNDQEMYVAEHGGGTAPIEIHEDFLRPDCISSSFIREITARAEGLPLYVKLVIDDIRDGRYDSFDYKHLPLDLHRYYNRLLERYRIGGVFPLLTPLVCSITTAKDALTFEQLYELVVVPRLRNRPAQRSRQMLRTSLDLLSSMLRTQPNTEREVGYAIYHQSLRSYLDPAAPEHGNSKRRDVDIKWLDDWIAEAKASMADRCAQAATGGVEATGSLAAYVTRFGVEHLLEEGRYAEALQLFGRLRQSVGIESSLLSTLANNVAVALDRAMHATALDDEDNENSGNREKLHKIEPTNLCALIGQTYETGVYAAAIRLLIEIHPDTWRQELERRLYEPYDIVFRHDVGEAYASVWLDAEPDKQPQWMAMLESMANRKDRPYYREIAGYALKHIYQRYPSIVNRDLLNDYANGISPTDRMIAGELLLTLVIEGIDIRGWVTGPDFWDPLWNYHRTDILDIRILQPDSVPNANLSPAGELDNCLGIHRYAETLRSTLRTKLFFKEPHRKGLAVFLEGYAQQSRHAHTLDSWITELGIAFDTGQRLLIVDFLRLLMCHPLWHVIEAASSLAASLIKRNSLRIVLIDDLMATDEAIWRVRYGALDAAFNIGNMDHHQAFRQVLLRTYKHAHCRVRGLCADDLLGYLRTADAPTCQQLLNDPKVRQVLSFWLEGADDSWLLEYVYLIMRFVHESHAAGEISVDVASLLPESLSPYLAGEPIFYTCDHHMFLGRIEAIRRQVVTTNDSLPGRTH